MIFELLTLGISALSRGIKSANNYAEGMRILKEREKMSVWDRAREEHGHVVINGHEHFFLTPMDITMSEKFWDLGLSLEDFYIKCCLDNMAKYNINFPHFSALWQCVIDKNGIKHLIHGFEILELYYKCPKEKIEELKNYQKFKK